VRFAADTRKDTPGIDATMVATVFLNHTAMVLSRLDMTAPEFGSSTPVTAGSGRFAPLFMR
jgi:hypothetical protein